jgi:hypothetical protein
MAQAAPRSSSAPTAPTRTTYAAPDFGANRHQNYPVLLSAQANGSNLSLEGELRSTPNRDFRIEVFGNTECDPSGTGEVVFQPGDGPKTVVVPVIGDADVEDTEVFYFLLYPLGASVSDGVGDGLIHDDDGATPTPTWTPSSTPTLSVTATNTPPPTNTPAPTNTNAPTATNTPAGTNTVAPTNTAPPTNTPTATMTASATEV